MLKHSSYTALFSLLLSLPLAAQEFAISDHFQLELALNLAIERGQTADIEQLLAVYRQNPRADQTLVIFAEAQLAKKREQYDEAVTLYRKILADRPELTPVRIQLAISLYQAQQNENAREQFENALSDQTLPKDIAALVRQYLLALNKRSEWNFSFSANYLNDKNVNNASSERSIENTAFVKGDAMLPQKAQGIGYFVGLEREFNLGGAHYLHFKNHLSGKNYWDNHRYDDIVNRTYLGYTGKSFRTTWSLLPFYEREWYGNHRYKRAVGIRGEVSHWLIPNWQLSGATEYAKQGYFNSGMFYGNSKLASATLLWRINPKSFVYVGGEIGRETTAVKSYGYDLKSVRLGWGQEWLWGLSSRVAVSYGKRDYLDNLRLGSSFTFDRKRHDKIYQTAVTLWKRDWHWLGITPKIQYRWKQQKSSFPSLYSYRDHSVNMLLETSF